MKVVTAGVLGYAIEQRWIGENVARKAKTPKIVRQDEDMVLLTIPEVEELADTAAKIGTEVEGLLSAFWLIPVAGSMRHLPCRCGI